MAPLEQVAFEIYTPALPKIAEHFAASNTLVQNTVTAYVWAWRWWCYPPD